MPISAQGAPAVDAFDGARRELEATIALLRGWDARPHTEIIGALRERGAEMQRRLFQGWLDGLFERERAETELWSRPRRAVRFVRESERWRTSSVGLR